MLKNCCPRALFKTGSSGLAVVEERWAKPFCLLFCLEVACSGYHLSCRSWAVGHVSALLLALLLHWEEQTWKVGSTVSGYCIFFLLESGLDHCTLLWEGTRLPKCSIRCWWTLPRLVGHIGYIYTSCQCRCSKQNCFASANPGVSITLEGVTNKVTFGYFLFCVLVLWASKTLFLLMKTETPPAKAKTLL